MTNPKTGWITREWQVESIVSGLSAAGATKLFSSAKHPVVSEAVLLNVSGQGTIPVSGATVIAHDASWPPLGTVGATQAATLGPQQFLVQGIPLGTLVTAQFAIRGR